VVVQDIESYRNHVHQLLCAQHCLSLSLSLCVCVCVVCVSCALSKLSVCGVYVVGNLRGCPRCLVVSQSRPQVPRRAAASAIHRRPAGPTRSRPRRRARRASRRRRRRGGSSERGPTCKRKTGHTHTRQEQHHKRQSGAAAPRRIQWAGPSL